MTGFTGSPLDRVDHIRSDPDAFAALLGDWRARVLMLDGMSPQIGDAGGLVWGSMAAVGDDAELVLLGLLGGRPHFVEVVRHETPTIMRSPAMFRALQLLPAEDAATFGTALSLITWHNNHRHCGRCGAATQLFRAGWGRKCDGCATEHFPRTDPVVIMLAEYQGPDGQWRALVGRQHRFPPGNYSALAGFLEPGESIEEAVRREIMEEAGIPCGDVRYVASQPWPFGGAQLMVACVAEALADEITIDPKELEDAMWVTRDDAIAALAGDTAARFKAPPPFAIAHSLLKTWVGQEAL